MIKKIYYPYPRRKWENDIVDCKFESFEIVPKAVVKNDEQINYRKESIKTKLKKYNIIKNIIKYRDFIRLKSDNYVPKMRIKNIDKYDAIISTQLFLKSNKKPYICYVENSHSILGYDYSKYANTKFSSKINNEIKRCIYDENFKGFVFYSYRSKEGFYKYFNEIIDYNFKFLDVMYPFVKDNDLVNEEVILDKCRNINNKPIELVYISSMFSLKGGCEIIEAFNKLNIKYNVRLNIITRVDTIPQKYKKIIDNSNNIALMDNKLSNYELQKLYYRSHILLHPTFMDSTAIVIMEALKSGLPVITTDTFAIPEYIKHGENGFLIENPIKFYDLDYKIQEPNEFFGSIKTAALLDKYKSNILYNYFIDDLFNYCEKIIRNYKDFALNAYNMSLNSEFSESVNYSKWNEVINRKF